MASEVNILESPGHWQSSCEKGLPRERAQDKITGPKSQKFQNLDIRLKAKSPKTEQPERRESRNLEKSSRETGHHTEYRILKNDRVNRSEVKFFRLGSGNSLVSLARMVPALNGDSWEGQLTLD